MLSGSHMSRLDDTFENVYFDTFLYDETAETSAQQKMAILSCFIRCLEKVVPSKVPLEDAPNFEEYVDKLTAELDAIIDEECQDLPNELRDIAQDFKDRICVKSLMQSEDVLHILSGSIKDTSELDALVKQAKMGGAMLWHIQSYVKIEKQETLDMLNESVITAKALPHGIEKFFQEMQPELEDVRQYLLKKLHTAKKLVKSMIKVEYTAQFAKQTVAQPHGTSTALFAIKSAQTSPATPATPATPGAQNNNRGNNNLKRFSASF